MPVGYFLHRYLRDLVFGAVDGTVTTFAIVAGAVGANLGAGIVIVLGIANLLADGFSMAVSNYLANHADLSRSGEHPVELGRPDPRASAFATFLAFVLVGAIPLIPFVMHAVSPGALGEPIWASSVLTALAFIGVGIAKSQATEMGALRSAGETLALGGSAAGLAFVVGWLLRGVAGV